VYGAALRLTQVLEELSDPLYFAAFPQLARAWAEARDEFFRLLRWLAAGLAALTTAVVLLGLIGAPRVVALALGPGYGAAVEPFRLLLVAAGVAVATLWATPAMLASGQPAVATAAATSSAASSCRRRGSQARHTAAILAPARRRSSRCPRFSGHGDAGSESSPRRSPRRASRVSGPYRARIRPAASMSVTAQSASMRSPARRTSTP
jgi:hypothetical protein